MRRFLRKFSRLSGFCNGICPQLLVAAPTLLIRPLSSLAFFVFGYLAPYCLLYLRFSYVFCICVFFFFSPIIPHFFLFSFFFFVFLWFLFSTFSFFFRFSFCLDATSLFFEQPWVFAFFPFSKLRSAFSVSFCSPLYCNKGGLPEGLGPFSPR